MSGLAGNDTLLGNAGNDTLDGGAGNDSIDGGAGNDTFLVRTTEMQSDTLIGGAGTDILKIDGTADLVMATLSRVSGIETFDGNGLALRGTSSADTLNLSGFTTVLGLTGIYGLSGNDTLVGSSGNDTLDGGANNDSMDGGAGDDTFLARTTELQSDTLVGGAGTDTLKIDGTADLIMATLSRVSGIEIFDGNGLALRGTSSADTLNLSGFTTVTGLTGIYGLSGKDTLVGSGGNDTLDGGSGNNSIDGGAGNDTFLVRTTEMQSDTLIGGAGTDTLKIDGTADLIMATLSRVSGIEIFDGNGLALRGTLLADTLDLSGFTTVTGLTGIYGLTGNDTLIGSGGADTIDGGSGNDTISAGAGADTIVIRGTEAQSDVIDGGDGQDVLKVDATGGTATLLLSSRITGVETINGGGVGLQGTSAANALDFSKMALVNVTSISGLAGNDTLAGGTGNDTLTGGSGNDTFVFHFGDTTGDDRITDFDASGNDVIRLDGYAATTFLSDAISFNSLGALINLDEIGGHGTIRLAGVTTLSLGSEDFVLG
ncbi:MAG: hypothetical protein QM699_09025 [Amaricoccus sp.]